MSKKDCIELTGTVVKVKPGTKFDVQIDDNGAIVDCTISGKLRINSIKILEGDTVTIEMSPYDLHKGRIIWRNK